MKKLFLLMSISLFSLIAFSSQVHALTLSWGDVYYVGYTFDASPANPSAEVSYINVLITQSPGSEDFYESTVDQTLNREGSTLSSLPAAVVLDADANNEGDPAKGGSNITYELGYDYILGKYDGQNAGSLVWYIGGYEFSDGETAIVLPQFWGPADSQVTYQLSHYSLYNSNPVPEPATMVLFGLGLLGLARVGRKKL